MLLALLAAAATASAAPPAQPAPAREPNTIAPATVTAPAKEEAKTICITERPTGSHRVERICYDKKAYDNVQDQLRDRHVRESPDMGRGAGIAR